MVSNGYAMDGNTWSLGDDTQGVVEGLREVMQCIKDSGCRYALTTWNKWKI